MPGPVNRTRVVAATALALGFSLPALGCGDSSEPRLSATVAAQLQRGLSEVRAAAEEGDTVRASNALSSFSRLVDRESRAGHLSAEQARGLRAGIEQSQRRIELELGTATPPPTPQPMLSPPTSSPDKAEGDSYEPKLPKKPKKAKKVDKEEKADERDHEEDEEGGDD